MEDRTKRYRQLFYNKIENGISALIPIHVKNILELQCMDNPGALEELKPEIFGDLEIFVRSDIYREIANSSGKLVIYT